MKVFNLLIIDDLTPWHCPEVSVKAFSNRECAESKMLEMFVSKRQELENEGYHVFKTDTFAPCCDENSAHIYIQTTEGCGEISWEISEHEIEAELSVETPLGSLKAKEVGEPDYPGIDICLAMKNAYTPLALVEFSEDEADHEEPAIISRIWGKYHEEEYTDRTIHQLPVVYDCTSDSAKECKLGGFAKKVYLLDADAPMVCPEFPGFPLSPMEEKPETFKIEEVERVLEEMEMNLVPLSKK